MNKKLANEIEQAAAVRVEHPSDASRNLTLSEADIQAIVRALRAEVATTVPDNIFHYASNVLNMDRMARGDAKSGRPASSSELVMAQAIVKLRTGGPSTP